MKKFYIVIVILAVFNCNNSNGQDKHFSMFFGAKVLNNPGAAGFFEGDYQAISLYRNQWLTVSDKPFNTIAASFDTRFELGNGFLGLGLNFSNDKSGDAKYKVSEISVPISYAIEISRTSFLSFGLAPGFYQRSIASTNVSWDNQWSGVGFDLTLPNGEFVPNDNLNVGKFNIDAGVYYQASISKYSWVSFGLSGQHLTKQKINFFNTDNGLYKKLTLGAFGSFGQKQSNLKVKPSAQFTIQGPNKMFVLGSGFDFKLKDKSLYTAYYQRTSIEFGVYYRALDAIMLNTSFHLSGLTVGVNFDITASQLTKASKGLGAMELLLAYRFNKPVGLGAPRVH
jgi:type IX secretion system PorP/SprF family membrane protein